MILRCRRLLHASSNLANGLPKPFKVESSEKFQFHLSPETVESTVSNCPSDTIALSFFLWCARQPNYFHDRRTFEQMVPIVARLTDRLGTVSGIVEELESVGCVRKPQTFLMLLRVYWRGNMHRWVLESFDEMGSHNYVPNTFARNIVLDVLFKIGHIDAALRLLTDTQCPNFLTFNIAIHNLCKLNDWGMVRGVLRAMVKKGFCPEVHTFFMVFICLKNVGRLMESLQLLGFMIVSGIHPTVAVWSNLIEGYCHIGRVDKAGELFGKMVDSGCSPTIVTYTILVKAFFEIQMFDKAFDLLDAMLSDGCKPDLVFYNVLIDFLCKSRRYDDVINVFLGMRERNIRPDTYTLASLTPILCSPGKMGLLPSLVRELDGFVDLVACNSLLHVFGKTGFPSQAVEFYNDMVDRGFTPDGYSFVGLLNGLFRSGRVDDAINVYRGIISNNTIVDDHVHSVVFIGLIRVGKFHGAVTLFRNAVSAGYCNDAVSYTVAIHGLFKGGRFEEACNLFRQMKQFGLVPNICTFNVMLHGFCKARDIDAVKKLLREILEAEIELDCISLNIIIELLIRLHRIRSASLVVKEMHDAGLKPNRATYSLLFRGIYFARGGEVENLYPVLKYYYEDCIFMDGASSDLFNNPQLCSRIVDILCRLTWSGSVNSLESKGAVRNYC